MFCRKCGAQLSDDAEFCANCGCKVISQLSEPKQEKDLTAKEVSADGIEAEGSESVTSKQNRGDSVSAPKLNEKPVSVDEQIQSMPDKAPLTQSTNKAQPGTISKDMKFWRFMWQDYLPILFYILAIGCSE